MKTSENAANTDVWTKATVAAPTIYMKTWKATKKETQSEEKHREEEENPSGRRRPRHTDTEAKHKQVA